MWDLFDKLSLLPSGKVVYFGASSAAGVCALLLSALGKQGRVVGRASACGNSNTTASDPWEGMGTERNAS